jgi:hypothetical protein
MVPVHPSSPVTPGWAEISGRRGAGKARVSAAACAAAVVFDDRKHEQRELGGESV